MKTLSVQQMPNGYELDTPGFTFWFKAGAAFTLGAGAAGLVAWLFAWLVFIVLLGGAAGAFRLLTH